MKAKTQRRMVGILAAIALTITYAALGFAICTGIPSITQLISSQTSAFDNSPYNHDDLIALAMETRNFTVDDYQRDDAGIEGAQDILAQAIIEKAKTSSAPDSPTHERWSDEARAVVQQIPEGESPSTTMNKLYEVGAQYSCNEEVISHLNDVNKVISSVMFPIAGIAVIAAIFLMYNMRTFGMQSAREPLLYAGVACVCLFSFIGLWAFINFNGFFTAFHSLFFAQDTWTFPADSLLISLYPQNFWIGMGIVWLAVSIVLALLSIDFGFLLKKRSQPVPHGTAADTQRDEVADTHKDEVSKPLR